MLASFSLITITKREGVLDAKGDPKEYLTGLSLLNINPSSSAPHTIADAWKGGEQRQEPQRAQ